MILKPFKVHSPDGKTFYEGDATDRETTSNWHPDFVVALYENSNPERLYTMDQMREYADAFYRSRVDASTSPSGEDAANGAIGEREAPLSKRLDDLGAAIYYGKTGEAYTLIHHIRNAIFEPGGLADRAALTAEKVAAEPVAIWRMVRANLNLIANSFANCKGSAATMRDLAKDCLAKVDAYLDAAPQQPAQSAEQDEPAAYLVRGLDCHNEEYATVWIKRGNAEAAAAAIYRASITPLVVPSAASTQATATQPAQTQVALTDEQVMSVSIINGEVTDYKYAGNLLDGEYPLYVVRHLTEGQAASILAAALRFETEGNKPMANDMRALLAAQPVNGGNSADQA
jgi:hypothetical protein